jgi:hypothetical protein
MRRGPKEINNVSDYIGLEESKLFSGKYRGGTVSLLKE